MNKPAMPATITATFLLRFWRKNVGRGVRWRGSIEHVPSGEAIAFVDFETMLRFLELFGICASDQEPACNSPEVS
jgi:hypothetical protein